ncbi:MAG: TonB-dependent receptor [Steroidobacteraceae bacterium]
MSINKNGTVKRAGISWRQGWYALVSATGLLLAAPTMARAEPARFDIPAQPLAAALQAFAAQARMQLLYEQSAVADIRGNAVSGELERKAALEELLRNTGLEVIYSSEGAATIRPSSGAKRERANREGGRDAQGRSSVQGSPLRSGADLSAPRGLEEVIVVARRREENMQSVPVAITVVSQEALRENNVQTLSDLQYLVPSMSSTSGLTRDALNLGIRGQGTNGISGLPGVIAYLNEVPIPTDKDGNLAGGPGMLFDLESVQVLKGPQGTLFGRNTTGGALLLQSARPTNDLGGRVQLTYGNHDDREIDGAINVPLIDDKLLTRVAFSAQQRDGFTRILADPDHPNGVDADDRDTWSLRGTVSFQPIAEFQNDTIVTYSKYDSHGAPLILTNLNPNAGAPFLFPSMFDLLAQQQALGTRKVIPISTQLESSGSNLSVNNISRVEFGNDLAVRNILGYDEAKTDYQFDLDATELPVFNIPSTPRHQKIRQISEEIQLLGKALAGRLDWIVGGFYLKQKVPNSYVLQTATVFGFPSDAEYRQGDESKALFAQGAYDLSATVSGVKLTLGARYTWDDRYYSERGGALGASCAEPRTNCDIARTRKPDSSAYTWTAGVDYQLRPATLLYLTSRRGYRAGGSNLTTVNGNVVNFDPEYVTDVEVGIKSDWRIADSPIRTNVAIYRQKYSDMQVNQLVPGDTVITSITSNAATSKVWGAELEAIVQLTDDLQLNASFDYLDLDYTKLDEGVDAAQLEATRTVNRPRRKYSIGARYYLPIEQQLGRVSTQVTWSWQDSSGDLSQPGGEVDAFGLLNAAINWDDIAGKPFGASVFASNLTDKEYTAGVVSAYDLAGFTVQRFGEPRMYGIRFSYRFGEE